MSANPFRTPEAFDTLALAGDYLPGLVRVGAVKRVFKWDKKEGPGTQGDTITYRGTRLVDFVIDLTMWLEEQIDEWDAARPRLEPDPRSVKALDVTHPVLDRQKVRSIVVAEIVELVHKGGGEFNVQIGVNEYKPPGKANATGSPSGSKSSGAGGGGTANKPPNAKTAQEEEIERLLKLAREP